MLEVECRAPPYVRISYYLLATLLPIILILVVIHPTWIALHQVNVTHLSHALVTSRAFYLPAILRARHSFRLYVCLGQVQSIVLNLTRPRHVAKSVQSRPSRRHDRSLRRPPHRGYVSFCDEDTSRARMAAERFCSRLPHLHCHVSKGQKQLQ